MARGYRVLLGRRAYAALERAQSPDRGRLIMNLTQVSFSEPRTGLLAVCSWRLLAACEVFAGRRLILVYAVRERKRLEAHLAGRE